MDSYLLTIITFLPLVGGVALLLISRGGRAGDSALKWTALIFALLTFAVSLALPFGFIPGGGLQFETSHPWINAFGLTANYHMAIDGLSIWLVLLTTLLVPLALISSWRSTSYRQREILISMLALETGMLGVFVAMDLLL